MYRSVIEGHPWNDVITKHKTAYDVTIQHALVLFLIVKLSRTVHGIKEVERLKNFLFRKAKNDLKNRILRLSV